MFKQTTLVCAVLALLSLFAPIGVMADAGARARRSSRRRRVARRRFRLLCADALLVAGLLRERRRPAEYRAQCEPGLGRASSPMACGRNTSTAFRAIATAPATPSRMALDQSRGVYPDEGLARHEWRKHGRCSGKSPTDYFADVRRASESVTIPRAVRAAARRRRPSRRSIFSAPSSPPIRACGRACSAVTCRKGALQEVRICFSRDLREFRALSRDRARRLPLRRNLRAGAACRR